MKNESQKNKVIYKKQNSMKRSKTKLNHSGAKIYSKKLQRWQASGFRASSIRVASTFSTLTAKGLLWTHKAMSFTTTSLRCYPKADRCHEFFVKLIAFVVDSTHFILENELQSGKGKSLAQRVKDGDEPTPGGLILMSDHMLILLCNLIGNHRACCFVGEAGAHKGSDTHMRPWE